MYYNWQQKDWTKFTFDFSEIESDLLLYLDKTAYLRGMFEALPDSMRIETMVDLMIAEALKTSEIEGEIIRRSDVKSSIRNNLGLNKKPEPVHDLRAIGLGELAAANRSNFDNELNQEVLFEWHRLLLSYRKDINVGQWRQHTEPMQIVSGAIGREEIHFEAPPSSDVPKMMKEFFTWFNKTAPNQPYSEKHAPVRSGIAHLWFETIHPFEDGNGRIGRSLSEKALSQGIGAPVPFSLSRTIEANKKAYYKSLKQAQRTNDLTDWLKYFVAALLKAIEESTKEIAFTVKKAKFFDRFRDMLTARNLKVINRVFDAGHQGFEGGINARKYASITGVSKATATRDLQGLQSSGILLSIGKGRNTRYELNLE